MKECRVVQVYLKLCKHIQNVYPHPHMVHICVLQIEMVMQLSALHFVYHFIYYRNLLRSIQNCFRQLQLPFIEQTPHSCVQKKCFCVFFLYLAWNVRILYFNIYRFYFNCSYINMCLYLNYKSLTFILIQTLRNI